MMQLSPKAIRFIIEAVEHYQMYHAERLRDEHLPEEEAADLTNDHQYLEALKTDLQQYQDELVCKGSAPSGTLGHGLSQIANCVTSLAPMVSRPKFHSP